MESIWYLHDCLAVQPCVERPSRVRDPLAHPLGRPLGRYRGWRGSRLPHRLPDGNARRPSAGPPFVSPKVYVSLWPVELSMDLFSRLNKHRRPSSSSTTSTSWWMWSRLTAQTGCRELCHSRCPHHRRHIHPPMSPVLRYLNQSGRVGSWTTGVSGGATQEHRSDRTDRPVV